MSFETIAKNFFCNKSNDIYNDLLFQWNKFKSVHTKHNNETTIINFIINSETFNQYYTLVFKKNVCWYFEDDDKLNNLKESFINEYVKPLKVFNEDELNSFIKRPLKSHKGGGTPNVRALVPKARHPPYMLDIYTYT